MVEGGAERAGAPVHNTVTQSQILDSMGGFHGQGQLGRNSASQVTIQRERREARSQKVLSGKKKKRGENRKEEEKKGPGGGAGPGGAGGAGGGAAGGGGEGASEAGQVAV